MKMPELDILREVLNNGLFMGFENDSILLSESGSDARLRQVKILGLDADCLVLKMDKIQIQGFFKGGGPNKRCDYLILTEHGDKKYAIFIEMKSTFKEPEIIRQFKGSECLIDYCKSVLTRFHGKSQLLAKYKKHFVIFYKTSINKTGTRPRKFKKNNAPEKAIKYADPHEVSLSQLIATPL